MFILRTIRFTFPALFLSALMQTVSAQMPIEPLLQKYCLGCHNNTEKEGGLSLQTQETLKKGGENGAVFDPGRPEMSRLIKVLAADAENAMPPEGQPQPTTEERELLRQWVIAGARILPMAAGRPEVPGIKPFGKVTPSLLASCRLQDGVVAAGGRRHIAALDITSGALKWRTQMKDARVTHLSAATRQPWIVAGSGMPGVGGRAVVISKTDGKVIREFAGHTDAVYAAVLNSDDTLLATAGYDRRILLHDVTSGKVLRSMEGHNGSVFSLSFDPKGEILCSASADGTVKVWNVASGLRLDTLSQPTAEQYAVAVSHDGSQIYAAGADNRIRVWRLLSRTSARINPMIISRFAHEQPITRLSLSEDGSRLASVAEDGTIQIWRTTPLHHHQSLPRQKKPVTSATFATNTELFLTYLDGSSVVVRVNEESSTDSNHSTVPNVTGSEVKLPEKLNEVSEAEGNDSPATAQPVTLSARISGAIKPDGGNDRDADCFRFSASAGQELLLEVNAQRQKSLLDSKIEVLTSDGLPIVRTVLQAVRDSYFTFRGKDSTTSGDFRLFNWQEMELNEFLYADGEVVKLWHYPRGPDSGYIVYPGFGSRFTYFDTTPTAHALQAPCFVVVPHHPDKKFTPNGLPTFPIHFENDDDACREMGSDSRLFFTAPSDGQYVVRLTDARGFSGEKFDYHLTIRTPKPDFSISVSTRKLSVAPGTGKEIIFTAKRIDGFQGPIAVNVHNLPTGFAFSGPIEIQREQLRASGIIYANGDATEPTAGQLKEITITASADGHDDRSLGVIEELKVGADPKLRATIQAAAPKNNNETASTDPLILTIRPGETIQAKVKLDRLQHTGVVSFGNEDSGRNLPHGVYVDNIGLNGLLLLAGQSEREFFITASKVASPSTSTFFLKSNVDNITSQPVTLRVIGTEDSEAADKVTTR